MAKRILFDLASARRVISALAKVAVDSDSQWHIGLGTTSGSSPHAIAVGTDNIVTVVWCEKEEMLAGCKAGFRPVDPAQIAATHYLGNQAFMSATAGTLALSTDATVSQTIGSGVKCQFASGPTTNVVIPSYADPNELLCSADIDDVTATTFLSGLGVLSGFGDTPAFCIQDGKVCGCAVGKTSGAFEVPTANYHNLNPELFYTLDRGVVIAALDAIVGVSVFGTSYPVNISVVDTTPSGGTIIVRIQSGPICVWAPCSVCPDPGWVDCLPAATIETVAIDWRSLIVMLSSFAHACSSGTTSGGIVLCHVAGRGLEGRARLENGEAHFIVESDMATMPEFGVSLTGSQVCALDNAVSIGCQSSDVSLSHGDGDELLFESPSQGWTIRLR